FAVNEQICRKRFNQFESTFHESLGIRDYFVSHSSFGYSVSRNLTSSSSLSYRIEMKMKSELSLYICCNLFRTGISMRHGPQLTDQKLRTTTLPFKLSFV